MTTQGQMVSYIGTLDWSLNALNDLMKSLYNINAAIDHFDDKSISLDTILVNINQSSESLLKYCESVFEKINNWVINNNHEDNETWLKIAQKNLIQAQEICAKIKNYKFDYRTYWQKMGIKE